MQKVHDFRWGAEELVNKHRTLVLEDTLDGR